MKTAAFIGVCLAGLAVAGAWHAAAQDEPSSVAAADEAAVVPEAAAATGEEAPQTRRDPFWPIGFVPPAPQAAQPVTAATPSAALHPEVVQNPANWNSARSHLELLGISKKGDVHYAILKHIGMVEAGDTVSIRDKDYVYRFQIESITTAGIATKQLDARPVK